MTHSEIHQFVINFLQNFIDNSDFEAQNIAGDFDLMASGLIDSMTFLNLIVEIEDWTGIDLGLEDLDPEQLTKMESLCAHIASKAGDT